MAGRIGPTRKRQRRRPRLFRSMAEKTTAILWLRLPRFSVSRTAMFAKPTVTEIEEVVCLVHKSGIRGQRPAVGGQGPEVGKPCSPISDP